MLRRISYVLAAGVLAIAVTVSNAEAQVLRKIKRAVESSVEGKRTAVEDSLATLAASPVDTGLARAARPLEAAATKAAERLAKAVAGIGPDDGRVKAEVARIEEGLDAGQADLGGLVFLPGAEFLDEGSAVTLQALHSVLSRRQGELLLRGRASREEALGDPLLLAKQRAESVRAWLVEHGIGKDRLRVAGVAVEDVSVAVTMVPLQ